MFFVRRPSHPVLQSLRARCITSRPRCSSTSAVKGKKAPLDEPLDPRPPWVYTSSHLLKLILVPSAVLYAVFVMDFGDHEHVFQPPRRWLARQKDAFFSLSPAQRALTDNEPKPASDPSTSSTS